MNAEEYFALVGELDGVADEVHEYLSQPESTPRRYIAVLLFRSYTKAADPILPLFHRRGPGRLLYTAGDRNRVAQFYHFTGIDL